MLSPYTKTANGVNDMEQNILSNPEMLATIPNQHMSDVALSFRIEAASSRVLYALSMPEYIEAWLQAPDAEGLQFVFSLVTQEAFRIDLYRAETLQASIHSSCRVVSANQVRYTWQTTSPAGIAETLVDMQLRGSSGGCILGLNHSGFRNTIESAWYCRMWHQSLERLYRLMGNN
jgi:uncharacterized protein YndB with AHSA1/START domain